MRRCSHKAVAVGSIPTPKTIRLILCGALLDISRVRVDDACVTNMSIPDPKAPPKRMQEEAKAERRRRKECHGDWTPCTEACQKETER